jgi:hypothetical protein
MNLSPDALLELTLAVASPVEVADRRCIPITGGKVTGRYHGTVLPGGADWQRIGADGTIEIDARYVLALEEGRVEIRSTGLRSGPPDVLAQLARGETVDPARYYFRTAIRFATAAPALARLNHIIALARGERGPDGVRIIIHEVT